MVGERGLLLVVYGEEEDEDAVPQSTIVGCELQSQYYHQHHGHHRRHCHKLQRQQQQHGTVVSGSMAASWPPLKQMRSGVHWRLQCTAINGAFGTAKQ